MIAAAETLNLLRSRSPRHAEELIGWTDRLVRNVHLKETEDERRLRHAGCLLSDIGWRAHPDHRGEQSLNAITNGHFGGITHQGRALLALAVYYRYAGFDPKTKRRCNVARWSTRTCWSGRAFSATFSASPI